MKKSKGAKGMDMKINCAKEFNRISSLSNLTLMK